MKRFCVTAFFCALSTVACSEDYIRWKWFEYPDPFTLPKVKMRCVKEASAHVPCPVWTNPARFCRKSTCIGHAYETKALRVTPTFVVSGPKAGNKSIRATVEGIAAGCAIKAVTTGKAAAAATPSPEPTARIAAALGSSVATFKACITSVTAAGVAGGIVRRLKFTIATPTHWARL
ncbi:hypothetical protein GGI55_001775 [Rhizobium leguminosarum]|uniref:hypothetical protein n=1 Tax=Rhizobium TaxID=379 RepID=UPI00161656A0|nr:MULTISPECIES: hypothetical protein [Rhizobium]MBB4297248.1 hypothetical protein [Rhizobium leguminosarum]MBB4415326.1 hypothetical protein [Rhizobium leguminosarum]MBB4431707.1 hypothetical protein [Rhizobium esperanzae]MBB4539677.1 hypothetical protein [Rhizobium leguminosarum]MBB5651930.1 hypothetical protein [Rhizobium leguminosarum]